MILFPFFLYIFVLVVVVVAVAAGVGENLVEGIDFISISEFFFLLLFLGVLFACFKKNIFEYRFLSCGIWRIPDYQR